jgi:hypothetical protein
MRVSLSMLLIAGIFGASCGPDAQPVSDDELAIIAAAVDSLYGREIGARHVVVQTPTDTFERDTFRDQLERLSVSRAVAMDFMNRNTAAADLRGVAPLARSGIQIGFASSDSIRRLSSTRKDEWDGLNESFPGSAGVVRVRRPGIDRSRENAVLNISFQCGGLCGTVGYAFLQKLGGRWTVTRFVVTARS